MSLALSQERSQEWREVEALVRLAQVGDRQALGQLFERFAGSIQALARRQHRDREEADELVQEVFLHVMRKIDQLREPACFGAWLRRITVRLAINRAVRRAPLMTVECDRLEAAVRPAESPLEAALRGEARQKVRRAVAGLRPIDRQALVAFYLKGKPLARIAAELEVPLGTVKRRLHVARKRLRAAMDGRKGANKRRRNAAPREAVLVGV